METPGPPPAHTMFLGKLGKKKKKTKNKKQKLFP
jgi:hypothetical protein